MQFRFSSRKEYQEKSESSRLDFSKKNAANFTLSHTGEIKIIK